MDERYDLKGSTYGRTSDKLLREGVDAAQMDAEAAMAIANRPSSVVSSCPKLRLPPPSFRSIRTNVMELLPISLSVT